MKKIIKKIKDQSNFIIFHLLDIGKINGNIIFSVFNIYNAPEKAPWVLFGIGYEKRYEDANNEKNYLILSFIGKQKRIKINREI